MAITARLDRYQRSHPHVSLPLAVVYKFVDDQGNYLAALITYYGLLSLLPLLLLLSTILNFALAGDQRLQHEVLTSALGQFPVVGSEIKDPRGVSGSGVGLVVGILGTLYGGLGVAQAAQNAMNTMWRVPRNERPNPLAGRARSLVLLGVVGLAVLGTTVLSAIAGSADAYGASVDVAVRIAFVLVSLGVNAAVFTLAFHVATARPLSRHETVPGAIAAAVAWQALQYFGTAYVGHVVKHASITNSVFALVLGLIAWIYVGALVVVFAVEYNAVRSQRLYPRSLMTPFTDDVELTAADRTAYRDQATAQRAKGFEKIAVTFRRRPPS
jgi:membrane protein